MQYLRSPKVIAGAIILCFCIVVLAYHELSGERTKISHKSNVLEESARQEAIKEERTDTDKIIIGSALFFGILMMLSGIHDMRKKVRKRLLPAKRRE